MKDADDRPGRTFTEIEAARSARGGFTRESFRELGVPYPPQKGWRQKLLQEARESGRERRPFKDALFSLCKAYGVDPDKLFPTPKVMSVTGSSPTNWIETPHRFTRAHDDDDIPPF